MEIEERGKYFHRCKRATYYICRHPIYPNDLQPVTKFPGLVVLWVVPFSFAPVLRKTFCFVRFTCLVCFVASSPHTIRRLELLHCIHSDTLSGSNVATSVLVLDIDQPQRKVADSKADYAGYGVGKSASASTPGSAAGGTAPYNKKPVQEGSRTCHAQRRSQQSKYSHHHGDTSVQALLSYTRQNTSRITSYPLP